jgi:hypothetical protein
VSASKFRIVDHGFDCLFGRLSDDVLHRFLDRRFHNFFYFLRTKLKLALSLNRSGDLLHHGSHRQVLAYDFGHSPSGLPDWDIAAASFFNRRLGSGPILEGSSRGVDDRPIP